MNIRAAIDIGTNSTRLLVAELSGGHWRALHRDLRVTRLGEGLSQSGTLRPEAVERTLAAVEMFAQRARGMGAQKISIAATYAARQADNGSLLESALSERGLPGRIVSGEEEAELAFRGVAAGLPQTGRRPLLVVDVGGGSTELIGGRDKQAQQMISLPLGAVHLAEVFGLGEGPVTALQQEQMRQHVARTLGQEVPEPWDFDRDLQVVAVGGTATSLVSVYLGLAEYDADRVHGQELSRRLLGELRDEMAALPLAQRRGLRGLQPERADIIVPGTIILEGTLDWVSRERLVVSEGDLLLGLLDANGATGCG